jgi:hypothetical protein
MVTRTTAGEFREYFKTVPKFHMEIIDTMPAFFKKADTTPMERGYNGWCQVVEMTSVSICSNSTF